MWTSSVRALADLYATYVDAVNRAVADDRDALVAELEQDYAAECERVLGTVAPPAACQHLPDLCSRRRSLDRVIETGLLLAGLMGSGKSSVGRVVADRRGVPYLDNDLEIQRLSGIPTVELAARGGDELHDWEAAYAESLVTRSGTFVAGLPGSCADHPDELHRLRERHVLFYLRCDVATLLRRVTADPPRPWLSTGHAEAFITASFTRRDPVLSATAQHVIDATSPLAEVVDDVLELLTP